MGKLVRSVASWECHVNLKTCSQVTNARKKIAFEITGGRGGEPCSESGINLNFLSVY